MHLFHLTTQFYPGMQCKPDVSPVVSIQFAFAIIFSVQSDLFEVKEAKTFGVIHSVSVYIGRYPI